ncbi:hypothetical protein [Cryptosporangium minutisporangium]|uniref:Uncharacterized protein n=1 Tax=Cryptosporangium minutisporangium TaxID=113569 RepID=A0ABP6SW54_9ACTN
MSDSRSPVHDGSDLMLLPHTWLYVPAQPTIVLTSYQQTPTADGVAYTATLSIDDETVGVLHNDGRGGATTFHANGSPRFRPADMAAYAAACRAHSGDAVAAEWVFDELISAWELEYAIQTARRTGQRVVRALDALPNSDDPTDPGDVIVLSGDLRLLTPFPDAQRDALAAQLTAEQVTDADRWWQIWAEPADQPTQTAAPRRPAATGQPSHGSRNGGWQDLTPRPTGVPDHDPAQRRASDHRAD